MVYREQSLGAFLTACEQATEMLKEEGVRSRKLTMDEGLIMQGASHLLLPEDRDSFYGLEVSNLTGVPSGTVYPVLNRFESHGLVESKFEQQDGSVGRPARRVYKPTERGQVILDIFQKSLDSSQEC